jgi:hypothetical protein
MTATMVRCSLLSKGLFRPDQDPLLLGRYGGHRSDRWVDGRSRPMEDGMGYRLLTWCVWPLFLGAQIAVVVAVGYSPPTRWPARQD